MSRKKLEEVKEKSTKSKIMTVMLCVALLCVIVVLVLAILDKDFFGGNNNQPQPEEKDYKVIQKGSNVSYELREYLDSEKKLYVKDKLVSLNQITDVFEIDDILLVVTYDSDCSCQKMIYLSNNGERIGSFDTKLPDSGFSEIKGKDIYAYSFIDVTIHQDSSSLCSYDDNEIVYVEEKMTYLGNNKFSEKEIIKTKTKKEMEKDRLAKGEELDCSDYGGINFGNLNVIELTDKNQEVTINGKTIKLRQDDHQLYLNDKKVEDVYVTQIIVQDKYILLINEGGQCAVVIELYINENGEVKEIKNRVDKDDNRQFNNFKIKDNVIVAEAEYCPCMDDNCPKKYNVKLVYDNKELSILKAN